MSGSSTFSSALVRYSRLKLWNTKPSVRLRTWASSLRSSLDTSCPSRWYVPLVCRSRQPMMFISVDLPDPDAPITATKSRASTANDTSRRARTSTSPIWYTFETVCSSMIATRPSDQAAHAARGGRGGRGGAPAHGGVGDDRVARLQRPFDHLGQRTVADAGADRDRLQLAPLVHPDCPLVVGVVPPRAGGRAGAGASPRTA